MKITLSRLRHIIKEEARRALREDAVSAAESLRNMSDVDLDKSVEYLISNVSQDFIDDHPRYASVDDVMTDVVSDPAVLDDLLSDVEADEPEVLDQFEKWMQIRRSRTRWHRGSSH